jgi:hypothetical protein
MNRLVVPVALFALFSCSQEPARTPRSEPAFTEGMRRLCEVDQRAGLDPDMDPITIESERYDWALAHVEHPDVIELLTLMRVRSDAERVEMLNTAAVDAGLRACPLADTLRDAS